MFAQGYADDGCVLVCGIILSTMCEIMQHIIRGIEHWCNARDLRVNPGKTELILFTRYGQQLQLTKQVKYLGVILDSKLNWKQHVDAKCQKA